MPAYPFSLPAPMVQGYGVAPMDKTARTDMDVGAARVRLRSRARCEQVTATWRFKNDEMAAFRAWFESQSGYNLLSAPEDFSSSSWTKSQVTVTANAAAAPDGTVTADKIVESAVNASHNAIQAAGSFVAGQLVTWSCYLQAAGRNWVQFRVFAGGALAVTGYAYIDIAAGAVGTISGIVGVPTVSLLPSGICRAAITVQASGAGTMSPAIFLAAANGSNTYLGDGTSGVYAWGAQLRAISSPLPYLPTTAGTVDGINFGADFFTISLPLGNNGFETRSARFIGPYKAVPVGRMAWDVSAQLEVR